MAMVWIVQVGRPVPVVGNMGVLLGTAIRSAMYGLCCIDEPFPVRLRGLLWPHVAFGVLVSPMVDIDYLPWHLHAGPNADKLLHVFLFEIVAFLPNLWLRRRTWRFTGPIMMPIAVLLPFSVAPAGESMQAMSPIRTASIFDLGEDLAGLLHIWGLSLLILRRWRIDSTVRTPYAK